MKVVIDNLSDKQALSMARAIAYHLSNECINVLGDFSFAKTWKERSDDLPSELEVEIRGEE